MHQLDEAVTVVIPTFNRADTVSTALQSLLEQTYAHWNALVVDDCSTDDTRSIAEDFCRRDARIRLLVHAERKGAQAARNTGIRAASSKWVAFLDSDDRYLPSSLEQRVRKAAETGLDVVHSACTFIDEGPGLPHSRFEMPATQGDIYTQMLQRPGPMYQGLLATKEALTSIGYLDETVISYQEWDTTIRLARHHRFAFVAEPTFVYRLNTPNSISRDRLRNARGYRQVFGKHFWSILSRCGPRAIANHYSTLARMYRAAGSNGRAIRSAAAAVLWWPPKIGVLIGRPIRARAAP